MLQQLLQLQPKIHQVNVDHGFWDQGTNRNKGEMVMLMITELSEAVEAHRKDHTSAKYLIPGNTNIDYLTDENSHAFKMAFESCIKNSIEDEIADTVIRLLDYCYGWNIVLGKKECYEDSTGNFANDVLELVALVVKAYSMENIAKRIYADWGYALAAILKFCEWYDIDLVQHTKWKLRYNKSRAHKHGKAY